MISDDEYLERIVAGVQAVTTSEAQVTWNEEINGRQFDVVVRFKQGTLRYLVLIEVKNRTRKATASDMDAFVLKARDQNASKAVFVTAAGFQSGAIDVAKRHAVDLFTVTFDETTTTLPQQGGLVILSKGIPTNQPPILEIGEPTLAANIDSVLLVYADGERAALPEEQSQMSYYSKNTRLADGRSLEQLVSSKPILRLKLGEERKEKIRLRPAQKMTPPDDFFFPAGKLKALEYAVTGRMARLIQGNMRIDPGLFTSPVVYTNVLTGETARFRLDQLPLGFEQVEVGKFYFLQHPIRYYYCSDIVGDLVHWYLIESFQNDSLIQSAFAQETKYSAHMIAVKDKNILSRLNRRLDSFRKLPGQFV